MSGSRKSQASSPWALTAQSLTCSSMEKPHTRLDECPRILLSCFRARNSDAHLELAVLPEAAVVLELEPGRHVPLRDALLDLADDLQLLGVALHLNFNTNLKFPPK